MCVSSTAKGHDPRFRLQRFPSEVENVVAMHPGVLEVATIGVPDERSGEAVKIFVVKKDSALTATELVAHCRELLTAYKVPSHVEFERICQRAMSARCCDASCAARHRARADPTKAETVLHLF